MKPGDSSPCLHACYTPSIIRLTHIFFTTSHARICIRYYKSRVCVWTCNEIEGLYDKIIITTVPAIPEKNATRCCCWLRTCNNTDSNELTIFSSIALYYGDTLIPPNESSTKWWYPQVWGSNQYHRNDTHTGCVKSHSDYFRKNSMEQNSLSGYCQVSSSLQLHTLPIVVPCSWSTWVISWNYYRKFSTLPKSHSCRSRAHLHSFQPTSSLYWHLHY